MNALLLTVAVAVSGVLAFHPRLRRSRSWSATVTPLASIMGSGFLVSAPLLVGLVGHFAPLAMAALLLFAVGVGSMIRFNIRFAEPEIDHDDRGDAVDAEHRLCRGHRDRAGLFWRGAERAAAVRLERVSHLVLACAYLISITYYLQLLGAFVLGRSEIGGSQGARILTTAAIAAIAIIGWQRGLGALEGVEKYAVAANFGMIVALLAGLAVFNAKLMVGGAWALPPLAEHGNPVQSLRVLLGLLIIVQGFETSRFLGAEHPAEERIATMRRAQLVSASVYLAFIGLAMVLFQPRDSTAPAADVTAIVGLVEPVATWLPLLIVIVAGTSQFSAAVADDAGCAGLIRVLFADRLPQRDGYLVIGAAAILLTWSTDVLQIISLASRAFAAFYALQCGVAATTALTRPDGRRRLAFSLVAATLGLLCLAVTLFGIPAD